MSRRKEKRSRRFTVSMKWIRFCFVLLLFCSCTIWCFHVNSPLFCLFSGCLIIFYVQQLQSAAVIKTQKLECLTSPSSKSICLQITCTQTPLPPTHTKNKNRETSFCMCTSYRHTNRLPPPPPTHTPKTNKTKTRERERQACVQVIGTHTHTHTHTPENDKLLLVYRLHEHRQMNRLEAKWTW